MTAACPSALERSLLADGELAAGPAAALEAHLASCADCRARVAALRSERAVLRALLEAEEPVAVPAFERPLQARHLLPGALALLAVGALASGFWSAAAAIVPRGLRWLSPLDPGWVSDLAVSCVLFIANEGSLMLTSALRTAAAAVVAALLASACAALLGRRSGTAAPLSVLLLACALPHLGHALEIRRADDFVTLPAGETVRDTLLAVGNTVTIDGDVDGDLLAFGRIVTVKGNVTGNVLAGAQTLDVQGTVGGSVLAGGMTVTVARRVNGNLYAGARDVTLADGAEVSGNVLAGANTVTIAGRVGADLDAGARGVVLRGAVARNVLAAAEEVTLVDGASVGGDLTAHVRDAASVRIDPGAAVGGTVDRRVAPRPQHAEPISRYFTSSFYVWQVVRLGMAFVTGLLLLWLFPGLRAVPLASGPAALRAAGIGFVLAVTLPVFALVAAITVIGLPLAFIAMILWGLGLYFAKTVVAQLIGRTLFSSPHGTPHYAATLLAGLAIVLIAVNLPWIGGLAGLLLTLVGLGMIATYFHSRSPGVR